MHMTHSNPAFTAKMFSSKPGVDHAADFYSLMHPHGEAGPAATPRSTQHPNFQARSGNGQQSNQLHQSIDAWSQLLSHAHGVIVWGSHCSDVKFHGHFDAAALSV